MMPRYDMDTIRTRHGYFGTWILHIKSKVLDII